MNQIEHLLRQKIGLDAATIGSSLIERAVRSRMRLCQLAKRDDYVKLLHGSRSECDALVESVVITETWFFRDRNPFQALVRVARDEWLPAHPAGRLRLLSLPCSSGEEPYSMAMALLGAGLPVARFRIDAVDISLTALTWAERAIYGKNSFRGQDLGFRTRYFEASAEGHSLDPAVRAQVSFQRGNVLDDKCLLGAQPYDIVFCRNLLIYFDRPTQKKVLLKLRRLLAPAGALFLGAAELSLALDHGFVSADHPLSFACRHADFDGKPLKPDPRKSTEQKDLPPPTALPANLRLLPASSQPPADLRRARQLADEGRLAEAAEICESHIREQGVSADAFYLLGLVRDASGADSQAGEFYRRALYLEPTHYETLMQWASLSKKHGNRDHARILLERAERVKKNRT